MKPKNFNKKLTLNKKTISHLGNSEMDNVYAGNQTQTLDICCTMQTLCPCVETKDPSIIPHICCH